MKITVFLLVGLLASLGLGNCENMPLGTPGNALRQADDALAAHKQVLRQATGTKSKELVQKKSEILATLAKADPFLARRQNELEATDLMTVQDHLKKSHEALKRLIEIRTGNGDRNDTTSAQSKASEEINSAEQVLNQYKQKKGEED